MKTVKFHFKYKELTVKNNFSDIQINEIKKWFENNERQTLISGGCDSEIILINHDVLFIEVMKQEV